MSKNSQNVVCDRCGITMLNTKIGIARHKNICDAVPTPHELREEKKRDKLTDHQLARRYGASDRFMANRRRSGAPPKAKKPQLRNLSPDQCSSCGIYFHHDEAVGAVCTTCHSGEVDKRGDGKFASVQPAMRTRSLW